MSLLQGLKHDVLQQPYTASDCVQQDKLWHSIHHHGIYGSTVKEALLQNINERMQVSHAFLKKTDWVIFTFGSAWVYVLNQSNQVVANCHKLPGDAFTKRLLNVQEITALFDEVLQLIKGLNPEVKFLFTVSPVRYIRDGLVENNLSKAVLLQSVHQITAQQEGCYYFPAYEIVVDELRDYRFFEADLVHPNKQAIDYVWAKFVSACMDKTTRDFIKAYETILTARAHRPLHKVPEEWERFKSIMLGKVTEVRSAFPFIDLSEDEQYFS